MTFANFLPAANRKKEDQLEDARATLKQLERQETHLLRQLKRLRVDLAKTKRRIAELERP